MRNEAIILVSEVPLSIQVRNCSAGSDISGIGRHERRREGKGERGMSMKKRGRERQEVGKA